MMNSPIFLKKMLLMCVGVVLMTLFMTTHARADDRVTRTHSFNLQGVEEVEISNSIGSIEIVQGDGDELRLVLDIESKRHGIFRRKVDVSEFDILVREHGDTLFLSFEEDDISADWVVELPTVERTLIEMGVGELHIETASTDLEINLGVGEVFVDAPLTSVGRIDLNVGVGDANVRGGKILEKQSAFISRSIRAEGEGSHPLKIDLGVGEISVRLND